MKGFPKNLNTKEDYEYVRLNFPKEVYKPVFQDLLDSEYDWFYVKDTGLEDAVTLTETQKLVERKDYNNNHIGNALYELKSNPACKMYQLGFSKEEVLAVING